MKKYRAALAAAAAAAAEEEDEAEDEEEEEDEEEGADDNLDEEEFKKRMAEIPTQIVPYAPNALGNNNGMKKLMAALEGPAVNKNNSQ